MNQTTKPKTRGRSEEKRQQIIEAASHLFTEQGFLSTSMDQVADAAGVSKQTVYSHFGTKDDLFRYCIEDRCIANVMNADVFVENQPLRDVLLHFANHFQALLMSREAVQLVRVCSANAELHPEISQIFYAAGPSQVEQALLEYLQKQRDHGTFNCDNLSLAVDQLLSLLKSSQHFVAILGLPANQHSKDMDEYNIRSVDMFLNFYNAR